ncbi:serine/threonine-protein phosphatase 4 regulatory subunit 3-like [Varroa destructor]|uniref:Serine/threonine-protein phosphatase 4 regulatory subunit 3-like central domain-containing protein n=1 Tax=Varroa destructor TaxID=109461 RepID=A0A7M7K6F3_VARDE|nr:serine/threonine-protein phosphatase 4 regulatory subunit 3-like [Varroa destructor]
MSGVVAAPDEGGTTGGGSNGQTTSPVGEHPTTKDNSTSPGYQDRTSGTSSRTAIASLTATGVAGATSAAGESTGSRSSTTPAESGPAATLTETATATTVTTTTTASTAPTIAKAERGAQDSGDSTGSTGDQENSSPKGQQQQQQQRDNASECSGSSVAGGTSASSTIVSVAVGCTVKVVGGCVEADESAGAGSSRGNTGASLSVGSAVATVPLATDAENVASPATTAGAETSGVSSGESSAAVCDNATDVNQEGQGGVGVGVNEGSDGGATAGQGDNLGNGGGSTQSGGVNNAASGTNQVGGQAGTQSTEQSVRRRVKLYLLNAERQWDDKGTGYVSSPFVESLGGISLVVRAEIDGSLLLESKVQAETAYQRQQGTLIVWSEGDNYDLALSFQERAGCDDIWKTICQIQGRDPSVDITQEVVESEDECPDGQATLGGLNSNSRAMMLPAAEIAHLGEIAKILQECLPFPMRRDSVASAIEADDYITKLLDVFAVAEDLEDLESLHTLYNIFKSILLLNKNALLDVMFTEENIMQVVGVLEYEPNKPRARHREYLSARATFHQVIPFSDPELTAKIHQTYRVQYIQEVVLPTPSIFEENMLSCLSSFVFFNKADIVSMLQEDRHFLDQLFSQLRQDTSVEQKRDLVLFLKEFCNFSQTLQPQCREPFFKALFALGILQVMEATLQSEDAAIKAASIDILSYLVDFSTAMVREYCLDQYQTTCGDNERLLMDIILRQILADPQPDTGVAVQLAGILRMLLDPETFAPNENKNSFLGLFYKYSMHVLTDRIIEQHRSPPPGFPLSAGRASLLAHIIEFLSFCVEHHGYHIKNYILHKDLLRRVLDCMKYPRHLHLALCALRFVRRIVGLKDDFYNRHIAVNCLLRPVVDALKRNSSRYNLLDSAIIELFEFIRAEDIALLGVHAVEHFSKELDSISYVPTFRALRAKFEEPTASLPLESSAGNRGVGAGLKMGTGADGLKVVPSIDGSSLPPAAGLQQQQLQQHGTSDQVLHSSSRFKRDPRQIDDDEEKWFAADDGEDDDPTAAGGPNSTVGSGIAAAAGGQCGGDESLTGDDDGNGRLNIGDGGALTLQGGSNHRLQQHVAMNNNNNNNASVKLVDYEPDEDSDDEPPNAISVTENSLSSSDSTGDGSSHSPKVEAIINETPPASTTASTTVTTTTATLRIAVGGAGGGGGGGGGAAAAACIDSSSPEPNNEQQQEQGEIAALANITSGSTADSAASCVVTSETFRDDNEGDQPPAKRLRISGDGPTERIETTANTIPVGAERSVNDGNTMNRNVYSGNSEGANSRLADSGSNSARELKETDGQQPPLTNAVGTETGCSSDALAGEQMDTTSNGVRVPAADISSGAGSALPGASISTGTAGGSQVVPGEERKNDQ